MWTILLFSIILRYVSSQTGAYEKVVLIRKGSEGLLANEGYILSTSCKMKEDSRNKEFGNYEYTKTENEILRGEISRILDHLSNTNERLLEKLDNDSMKCSALRYNIEILKGEMANLSRMNEELQRRIENEKTRTGNLQEEVRHLKNLTILQAKEIEIMQSKNTSMHRS